MLYFFPVIIGCGSADPSFSTAPIVDAGTEAAPGAGGVTGNGGAAAGGATSTGGIGSGGAWPAECGVSSCRGWLSGPPWPEIHCKADTDCCRNQICDGLLPSEPDKIGLCISRGHENDAGTRRLSGCVVDFECVCGFHCSLSQMCNPGP
jgi:hypothetical protein